ncbi:unnamed protein product [Microthlaspi erraticum]|uniref:Jacalin-type lectin domain-containing protein n=1 Tax=Microthlaspi erraticum TaxID=1685480 RepID=A0A6D2KF90_9BRAS|nr:unnamed protein product [Microthlaspi erraticum]
MFKVGPIGSKKYNSDKSWDEKGHSKISNIYVSFDDNRIKSIQFSYFHKGAHLVSQKHGSGGKDFKIVRLEHDEYVTGLSGVDCSGIKYLIFHTNKRKHGTLCATGHTNLPSFFIPFKREIDVEIRDGREFGGFFGSFCGIAGHLITIGIYVSPITDDHRLSGYQSLDHIGPIGDTVSKTDTHWDEKGNTMVSHIFVSLNSPEIISIQFGYTDKGALVLSQKYGGPSEGQNFRVVKLKHSEYVTGLSGKINWCHDFKEGIIIKVPGGIKSLKFSTNLGEHICEPVTTVSSSTEEIDLGIWDSREFGGFFGSCDTTCLKSIGIYVSPIPSSNTAVKREKV